MADDVVLPGTGAPVAADEAGTAFVQLMKLAYSADGVRTHVEADSDGLKVKLGTGTNTIGSVLVTSVTPGTGAANLGKAEDAAHTSGDTGIMPLGVRNDADATLSGTDGDYTPFSMTADGKQRVVAGRDQIRISVASGGLTTATTSYAVGDQVGTEFALANAARATGGGGMIVGIILISAADIIGAYDVVFTDSSITLAGDNAAYAISDSDALKIIGVAQLSGALDLGNNRIAQLYSIAMPYVCAATTLYASLITRSAHTFFAAVNDLQLVVFLERN